MTDAFPGLSGQPHAIVERDGVRFTLLGTAHVSHSSVDAVRAAIDGGDYDTIAVELDPHRLQSLTDPDAIATPRRRRDVGMTLPELLIAITVIGLIVTVLDRAGLEAAACECYGTVREQFEALLGLPAGA